MPSATTSSDLSVHESRRPEHAHPPGLGRGGRGRARRWNPWPSNWVAVLLLLPCIVAIALFVVYPLAKLVLDSFTQAQGLGTYTSALKSPVIQRAMYVTFAYSAVITVLAVLIGTCMAWTMRVTKNRIVKTVIMTAVLAPFLMGVVVKNYAFTILLGREGVVNDALVRLHIFSQPHQILFTKTAVVVGILYAMIPYAVFTIYAVLLGIDLNLLDAARGLGASRARSVFSIAMPLALPGIAAAAAITFAISLGFYVTPIVLGGITTPFMATVISQDIFSFYDYPEAAAASVLLLAAAIVVLAVAGLVVGRERLVRAVA